MDRCDVLIVGGGPAGSTCAWKLVRAGLDVVVVDKARFPRDKVCAGWITPAVVRALALDLDDYASRHTLQPFTGFRTGPIGRNARTTDFGTPISYGIRRCEFDDYLLRRSGARVETTPGVVLPKSTNDSRSRFATVGAGGQFCPVARQLNPRKEREDVVVAQEIEFPLDDEMAAGCRVRADRPELFFWPDFMGYGWCVRKGRHMNIGAGRLSQSNFPAAVREFTAMLDARAVTPMPSRAWKGHAYLLDCTSRRRVVGDRTLLIGDAAGLALSPSGEGILAAVESGLMAAAVILETAPDCTDDRLAVYADRIEARFGPRQARSRFAGLPAWVRSAAAHAVFNSGWLTRRVLLEDGFLHVRRAEMTSEVISVRSL
jgi:flavin-dependent dehydrogenase